MTSLYRRETLWDAKALEIRRISALGQEHRLGLLSGRVRTERIRALGGRLGQFSSEKILCAFCKLPRRVYSKRDISVFETILILGVTGLFSYLIWESTNFKSLIFFAVMTVSLQVFYRVRWRHSVRCPHCNFDPIQYKNQPEDAAQSVKAFLEARKNDPKYLLRPKPQITPRVEKTETWRQNLPATTAPGEKPAEGLSIDV